MYPALVAIIASASALVQVCATPQPRQNCPEVTRFANAQQILTVIADFNCAINTFGIVHKYTDYYIEAPANNGYEPPILLARRTLPASSTSDTFTVAMPDAHYFANAGYVVMLETTYPVNGTKGISYFTVGGIETGITINV